MVLELVRAQIAACSWTSHTGGDRSQRTFKDLGFDSLPAVELRNRLGAATGSASTRHTRIRLSNPSALVRYLLGEL